MFDILLRIFDELRSIKRKLSTLINQGDKIMAKITDFDTQLSKIDAETTRIAGVLNQIKDELAHAGLTDTDEDSVLARLTQAANALELVGKPTEPPVL